jgi:hypothetical protein
VTTWFRPACCLFIMICGAWRTSECQPDSFDLCGVGLFAADPSAETLVRQILQNLLQRPDTILVFASTDPGVAKRGAVSSECPMGDGIQRWIVYDPEKLAVGPELDFALAHETAHHMNRHVVNGAPRTKGQELEADEYAARYLTRLGWDDSALMEALSSLKLPLEAKDGYPSLDERKNAVLAGYEKEKADVVSNQEKSAIQDILNRYSAIFTERKAKSLREIWPNVSGKTVNEYEDLIATTKNLSLLVTPEKWEHHGTGILVTCRQIVSFERNSHHTREDKAINFYMVKSQGRWIISDIPESSD